MPEFEQALIVAAVGGDRVSQERLLLTAYDSLLQRIERQLPQTLRDTVDAEDVMQLVMTQAFLNITSLNEQHPAGLRAWLNRLADNEVASQMRHHHRLKRGGALHRVRDDWDEEGSRRLWNVLQADESTASQKLSYAESRARLHLQLDDLPARYRQAIKLRYFQECPLAEIARRMHCSAAAVRGLLDRARKLLRQELDSW